MDILLKKAVGDFYFRCYFIYIYDDNGNMLSETVRSGIITYECGIEKCPVRIDYYSVTYSASKYYPFGRRIENEVSESMIKYVYNNEDIFLELDVRNLIHKIGGFLSNSVN